MFSFSKTILQGHCGRDCEVRYAPSGDAIANFSLATSKRWKDKNSGEMKESTQWHRITAFGRLAELAGEYIVKGTLVYIEGEIKYGKYTDQSGVEKNTVEINASELKFWNKRDGEEEGEAPPARQAAPASRPAPAGRPAPAARTAPAPRPASGFDDMDDDIPF